MSLLGIVLLVAAAVLLVAVEWQRIEGRATVRRPVGMGRSVRRQRPRKRRGRAKLEVVHPEHEEFARSVERDLASLPTIDERDVNRH